ncbi:hypothetical protein EHI8A_152320 [Entamoeba histolytica HM-1:IMSS-B]|uniref:Uncharacterized protein n=5 Tax=Entamoeba histolytica TaxID=5759 RepID=C4MAN4_ENTH1|nr:hypothetical protein EHI_020110 [Entamoeba histolytica HM-1:IMSS]EMD48348.1 Hypothetical protein EHI5A_188720 [Entamoeba histolytica KU27]EMH72803.1 hypothetical protein EHI8A_152320 [Entamoeba histolytica HM-1:IMSS-B]EMS13296.1 hypothetical protein KM1_230260 [Entamoeba histolytica HM-3:IMSS]GAT98886.1 hypothetical protein CL6EHI_020110 [Entamoeba histolytica]EAL44823.1 hypothetical protein EHI_020110 [Entamoeba histolytica HM-1:IMSS]|eukprot:XP_650210.1 hypothetical protein EHI_020110 [Entamoeba histolytica HM-1:IMSS]
MNSQHQDIFNASCSLSMYYSDYYSYQQGFANSLSFSYSMSLPPGIYSPLLVVTPMHIPMVEDEEKSINQQQTNLSSTNTVEQDVFVFEEQIEYSNLLRQSTVPIFVNPSSIQNNIEIRDEIDDFIVGSLDEESTFEDNILSEESSENSDDDREGLQNGEECQLIQEIFDRLCQLKRDGEERNKILQSIIEHQK